MKMHPIRDVVANAAADGLKKGARGVLRDARARVPVDDGELKRSGRVVNDDLEATVKFIAPHAWLQHEKLEYQHPGGGEAKYLEKAALEYDVAGVVGGHVRAALGG